MSTVPDDLVEGFRLVTEEGFSVRKAAIVTQVDYYRLWGALNLNDIPLRLGGSGGMAVPSPTRLQILALYAAGMPVKSIGRTLGCSRGTVYQRIHNSRMNFTQTIPPRVDVPISPPTMTKSQGQWNFDYHVDRVRVGRGFRLHPFDRVVIYQRRLDGWSVRKIAAQLGRSPSVISRELARNTDDNGRYDPLRAEQLTYQRTRRTKLRKLQANAELRRIVVSLLNAHISPLRIASRLSKWFGTNKDMTLSPETIYQALYVQGAGALREELAVDYALRSGRRGRKPRSKLPTRGRGAKPWVDKARYSDRPAQADDRSVPGHWEGDLVIGRGGKTAVVTLVERRSRMFFCRRLTGDRSSLTVIDMLKSMLLEINQMQASGVGRIDTLTWDQGTEMARVAELESEIDGLKVYFCDPHSPWQRPSNENINAELRRFYPKKTDFDDVTDTDLHRVQELINDTPRVVLDGATPREVFFGIETGPPVAFTE